MRLEDFLDGQGSKTMTKLKKRLFIGALVFLIAVLSLTSLARADWMDIPWDKRLHFKGGLFLGGMGYIISRSEGNSREKSFILSFSIGTLAGILYELVMDSLINKVEADWEDSLYVTLGSATATAVCASLDYIFFGELNFGITIPL